MTHLIVLLFILSPLQLAERQIVDRHFEWAVGFDSTGKEVCQSTNGALAFVEVPQSCVELIRNTGELLHSHVSWLNARYERDCPSFSPGDILWAAAVNLKRTTVISRWYGRRIEISATRVPTGWKLGAIDLVTIYGRYKSWLRRYGVCSALSATWTELAPKFGFIYRVRYL